MSNLNINHSFQSNNKFKTSFFILILIFIGISIFYLFIKRSENNKEIINIKSTNENMEQNTPPKINQSNSIIKNNIQSDIISINQYPIKLDKATVVRHIDGDTVVIKFENGVEEKVRFIGVDTPETVHKTKDIKPYGRESSDYTKESLLGETIYVEKDVSERDKYGRILRYIWFEIPKEITEQEIINKMFNATIILEGYAQVSTFPPDIKYVDYFIKFQHEAQEQNKGLWDLNTLSTNTEK